MWKCLLILVIVQTAILSQPVSYDNKRDTRNFNFEECCPCPSSDRSSIEQDSRSGQVPHDCPCKTASDSDTAASVFRPVMRAVEPFIRPGAKANEPKPLLRPEVGLASSVLETLREVTDQEYQEALAREAARSAIEASEPNIMDRNSPRNIVNIILKEKDDRIDDVMPEASNIQEARYIHPPLAKSSGINENRLQLLRNTLLPLSKVPSKGLTHQKIFDMDNSASNLQEQTLQPLRSNFFDDLKLKSDLLKTKLFPGIENSLGIVRSHLNTETDNNRNIKFPSLLDHIRIPKENDLPTISSNIKNKDKYIKADTIVSSPSNAEKYVYTNTNSNNFRNSPQSTLLKMNNNLDTKKNNVYLKTSNKIKNISTQPESTLIYNNDKSDIDVTEISDNNDCNVNNEIEKKYFSNDNHIPDTVPSPPEISEVTPSTAKDLLETDENEESDIVDKENINGESNILGDNIQHTNVEEIVPSGINELISEENSNVGQIYSYDTLSETANNIVKDENLCDIEDSDVGSSSNIPQTINLQENSDTNVQLDNVNEAKSLDPLNFYEQRSVDENILRTIPKNVTVDENHKVNTLPNMKENILKTLENFKKTNEKIQERIKANVQDALQALVKKNSVDENGSSPNAVDSKKPDDDSKKNNIEATDLQEMSNHILNLSNIKEDEKLKYTSQSRANQPYGFKYDDNGAQSKNDYVRVSALDDSSAKLRSTGILNSAGNDHQLKEIGPKILEDPCAKYPKKSNLVESNTDLDQNEMISEASSPIVSSTHHVVPPKKFDVKNVLDNFKSSVTDFFNNQRESILPLSVTDSENDNTLINAIYEKNAQASENYLPRTNKDQRLDIRPKIKNSNSNLSSYKAKIAVPASLNREYYRESNEDSSRFNTLRSQIDTISPLNSKSLGKSNADIYNNMGSKSQIFNTFRNVPQSTDNSKFKPHNVLKNIQDAFDLPSKKPIFRNQSNLLSKSSPSDIFRTITKTNNELNENFRAFQLGLNDKISSFSQRIADIRHMPLKSEPRFKNIKSNLKHAKLPNLKNRDIGRTSALTVKESPLKLNILQDSSKLVQKLKNPTQVTLDSKTLKLKEEATKRKGIKLKPLKENKVTIFLPTTIRPDLILKRKNPLKSPNSKLLEIKSKLKSSEPRNSASERIVSRVPFSNRPSQKEEEMSNYDEPASTYKINTNSNSEGTNRRKAANSVMSKIREAVKVKAHEGSTAVSDDNMMLISEPDEVLSASDLSSVALKDRSLKENVSYKCKLMCIEDHGDFY